MGNDTIPAKLFQEKQVTVDYRCNKRIGLKQLCHQMSSQGGVMPEEMKKRVEKYASKIEKEIKRQQNYLQKYNKLLETMKGIKK